MACVAVKKLLGYELCVLEKEGTLFYSDPIVIIRKEGLYLVSVSGKNLKIEERPDVNQQALKLEAATLRDQSRQPSLLMQKRVPVM